jgi:hypothetical protein
MIVHRSHEEETTMAKQKKMAMEEQREQPRLGPKQCPRQFCQSWMDSQATECPYCNHQM